MKADVYAIIGYVLARFTGGFAVTLGALSAFSVWWHW